MLLEIRVLQHGFLIIKATIGKSGNKKNFISMSFCDINRSRVCEPNNSFKICCLSFNFIITKTKLFNTDRWKNNVKGTIRKLLSYRSVKWPLIAFLVSNIILMIGLTILDHVARTNEGMTWMWLGILGISIWFIPIAFVIGLIIDIVKSQQAKSK